MKKVIIVGAGSVGKFLAYNANHFTESFEFIGFLDDDDKKQNTFIAGLPVLGKVSMLADLLNQDYSVAWGIAFPQIKANLVKQYESLNADYPTFVAKSAWISHQVNLGKGTIIYPGCSINYESMIGDFVVMNMNCALGHNATIGDFVSLAPGVNLGGYTQIGNLSDIGVGAATKQFISIGENCIIGGQAMVVNNIPNNQKVKGIPAK
jgi:sugar O-acyltransferase (sialic acid O-acetyltransferase NeuD family)